MNARHRRPAGSFRLLLMLTAGALGLTPQALVSQEPDAPEPFPHLDHEGLFPLCTGCHGGVDSEVRDLYPAPDLCSQCHDGEQEETVIWTGPTPRASNVRYEHLQHAGELLDEGDEAQSCTACHAASPDSRWTVNTAELGTCWGCHAHERADHFTGEECFTCHVPLSESSVSEAAFEGWTTPADHEIATFLEVEHGRTSLNEGGFEACATCHTRERCTSCHVDGGLDPIPSLGFAPSTLRLPRFEATYPTPGSHEISNWLEDHNTIASLAECGTCHTQQDCMSCHVDPAPGAVESVLSRGSSLAPGVGLIRRMPATHERAAFLTDHGSDAASDDRLCASCHRPVTCVSCHLGGSRDGAPSPVGSAVMEDSGPLPSTVASLTHVEPTVVDPPSRSAPAPVSGFHPVAYDLRHAADAWGANLDCGNCHNTTVFCRSCHVESGLGSSGLLGRGYHDAAGPWVLRHGQAARQALESCASCHRQKECMQCHSTTGGFRVNPHGPGFDADLAWEKGKRTCQACHTRDPIGGRP